MRLITLLTASALTTTALSAHADLIYGATVSAGAWYQGGVLNIKNGAQQADFEFEDQPTPLVSASLEHPVPLLPNARVSYSTLEGEDQSTTTVFEFAGRSFVGDVATEFELEQLDLVGYYELPTPPTTQIDLGLGARHISGDVQVSSSTGSETGAVDTWIPLGFVKARVDLPFTGLSVQGLGQGFSYDNEHVLEAAGWLGFEVQDTLLFNTELQLGYRYMDYQLNNVGGADLTGDFKGPWAALAFDF